ESFEIDLANETAGAHGRHRRQLYLTSHDTEANCYPRIAHVDRNTLHQKQRQLTSSARRGEQAIIHTAYSTLGAYICNSWRHSILNSSFASQFPQNLYQRSQRS